MARLDLLVESVGLPLLFCVVGRIGTITDNTDSAYYTVELLAPDNQ